MDGYLQWGHRESDTTEQLYFLLAGQFWLGLWVSDEVVVRYWWAEFNQRLDWALWICFWDESLIRLANRCWLLEASVLLHGVATWVTSQHGSYFPPKEATQKAKAESPILTQVSPGNTRAWVPGGEDNRRPSWGLVVTLVSSYLFIWLCQVFTVAHRVFWWGHPDFSSCGLWAPELTGSVVRVNTGLTACRILVPRSGIKPATPALEGRFLTTGPPGKSFTGISSLADIEFALKDFTVLRRKKNNKQVHRKGLKTNCENIKQ